MSDTWFIIVYILIGLLTVFIALWYFQKKDRTLEKYHIVAAWLFGLFWIGIIPTIGLIVLLGLITVFFSSIIDAIEGD